MVETSPDIWLAGLVGGYETIIALAKAGCQVLALALALRGGTKSDLYNPGFAYSAMFISGLAHGLYPGLTILSSFRSLVGSAAPFAFGFAVLPFGLVPGCHPQRHFRARLCRAVRLGIAGYGVHPAYNFSTGALRLGGSGEPPLLADFALIGIYAGLVETVNCYSRGEMVWLVLNFIILLATSARAPLAFAVLAGGFTLQSPSARSTAFGRLMALASAAVISASTLNFLRMFQLAEAGQATSLSNRNLV